MISRRLGEDRERGVSAVEFAMLMPVFLPLIFLLVQAGLYYHAVNVTHAVAQTTARVIRTYPGGVGQAPVTRVPTRGELEPRAREVAVATWETLDANKTSSQPSATVDVDPGSNQLTVTIESRCVNLLPGILPDLPLTAQASGPIEIFKPQNTN
ncbi:MAG TPA: TadE/TadG family type IV pilus assembly protein [Mycobacteriales bacterium]|nr:TadE/TadG family type IV pilus assembly protein [Mycobacteriales bacterium]